MKTELNDCNYENLLNRLSKGSAQQKAVSLKKFNFLYENARSRIYLYERRITESLQLLLLMEQNDIANLTLSLLEKIINNATLDSEIFMIIKKRLLSKIVLNLGSIDITTRKISHRCILQYIRKFKDYQSIITNYVKTAIQQTENIHLKLKSINSFRTLVDMESKAFEHGNINTQILMQQLIYASYQKQQVQIRKAGLLCLIEILRLHNSEKTLKMICPNAMKQLNDLKLQNPELASLIDLILKYKSENHKQVESDIDSAPSPKFMSISEQSVRKQLNSIPSQIIYELDKAPSDIQLKISNDLSFAQQFLKKLQKGQNWQLDEIKEFAPHLQKYLIDENIKLFSISKKIVETIFDSECKQQKQYYVVLVPCVVNGIGNKRFIVRRHLDKLIRQYIKNHTEVWVYNFMERFAMATNPKVKQILMELFLHAYRSSPQFYHPYQRTFKIMETQIKDTNSNLKWRAVDCLITVLQKQSKNQKDKQDMMSTLSSQVYHKVLRKMNKTHNSIGSNSGSVEPLSPVQKPRIRGGERRLRLVTDEPTSIQRSKDIQRIINISQEKAVPSSVHRQKRVRKSQADVQFNFRKVRPIRERERQIEKQKQKQRDSYKQERNSIKRLPQLKKSNNLPSINANTRRPEVVLNESPVKKSMGQKNIMYIDKENLPQMSDPKNELQKALIMIRDNSWNTQFESINCFRSIIEYHKESITDQYFTSIISELLLCLNNLRSGVSKIALICLGQLIRKFHRKSYSFTQQIVNTLIKKSMTTSQFIQQQIKRCISISAEQLCPNKMISSLNALKDNAKGPDIKISILGMIDAICQRNEKLYNKQTEWIWNNLIEFHQDHNSHVKNESRRVARGIIEHYPTWKSDISGAKTYTLQKIDKILKSINANHSNSLEELNWLQKQNKQLSKLISAKTMTPKYFANEYPKIEEQDKFYASKKNFKQRIKLLNNSFLCVFEHKKQFQQNTNAKKYLLLAIQHIDQKNPGLLLNSLSILTKCLQILPEFIESEDQIILAILERILSVTQTKRVEMGQCINNFLKKFYETIDNGKCCKQLLKLLHVSLAHQNSGLSAGLSPSNNGVSLNIISNWNNFVNSSPNAYDILLNNIIDLLKNNSANRLVPINSRYNSIEQNDEEIASKQINMELQCSSNGPKQEQESLRRTNSKKSKFECIENMLIKIVNKLASENYLTIPNLIPKFKEILNLSCELVSAETNQKISKNKQLIFSQHRQSVPKRSSGTKDLNSGQTQKRQKSLSIQRTRHRKKLMSGERKISPQKQRDLKPIQN